MSSGNGVGRLDKQETDHLFGLFPRISTPSASKWRVAFEAAVVLVSLVNLTIICYVIVPAIVEAQKAVREERIFQQTRDTNFLARELMLENARKKVIDQQAQTIALQEQAEQLAKENARLAAEINKNLRGNNDGVRE